MDGVQSLYLSSEVHGTKQKKNNIVHLTFHTFPPLLPCPNHSNPIPPPPLVTCAGLVILSIASQVIREKSSPDPVQSFVVFIRHFRPAEKGTGTVKGGRGLSTLNDIMLWVTLYDSRFAMMTQQPAKLAAKLAKYTRAGAHLSRMNFPSLYFWLFSNASSCEWKREMRGK